MGETKGSIDGNGNFEPVLVPNESERMVEGWKRNPSFQLHPELLLPVPEIDP